MAETRKPKKQLPAKLDLVFSTFIEVTGLITTGASMARIVTPILACACDILGGWEAFALIDEKGKVNRISYACKGRGSRPLAKEEQVRPAGTLAKLYKARRLRILAELPSAKEVGRLTACSPAHKTGGVIVAPLTSQRIRLGMVGVLTRKGADPDPQDVQLFELLTREAAVAIRNARAFERTQTLSITDGLTGAYNYRFLVDITRKEIDRASRFGEVFSLIMIDVDSLKDYNDVHGHLRGSGVIKKVATITSSRLRSIDMLCKYGGDEFVVLLPRTPKAGAALAAERIRKAIEETRFPGEARTGKITASMGIASFPEDGRTMEDLISNADKVLYRAKRNGRNMVWVSGKKTPYTLV
jgi:diguanylate cyclase (GGDEF)-like protein